MKKLKIYLFIVLGIILLSDTVYAAEFLEPSPDSNDTLITEKGQQYKDLYASGGNVLIDSETFGDLFVGGGSVTVTGSVEKDLFVGGGNINLSGRVGDDLRVAGGNVTVKSFISGDFLVAGGNIVLTDEASIGGDLIVAGGNVTVNSPVVGNVKILGGKVTINNSISGVLDIKVKDQLLFGPKSQIANRISYSGPKEAVVAEGARISMINYTKIYKQFNTKAFLGFGIVIDLIAWLIAALLLFAIGKNRIMLGLRGVKDKPWLSIWIGLLGVIVAPAIVVILFASVIGYYIGLVVLAWYLTLLLIGLLFGSMLLGSVVMMYINKAQELPLDWISVIVGVVLTKFLILIPFIGWIIVLILTLLAVGTMLRMAKYEIIRNRE